MAVDLKVPSVGESITEVQIGTWMKQVGDYVELDEDVVEIDTDKVTTGIPSPTAGVITELLVKEGDTAMVGDVIARIDDTAAKPAGGSSASAAPAPAAPSAPPPPPPSSGGGAVMPAAQRVLAEKGISADSVQGTGPGGRVTKEDAQNAKMGGAAAQRSASPAPAAAAPASTGGAREEEVVKMSPLRKRIAERLVEAQSTAAMLTTFNEVDMTAVMNFRKQYQDDFVKRYEHKIGFMSFFVKATIDALKNFPSVNAEIRGTDIVYKNYYDIGIAVGGGKGLVVPIIRNAERLSFSQTELAIGDFGKRAKANKIGLDELQGGTFTITNGGVYGSMMSTPILNPPQSGILGMHNIIERPIGVNGEIKLRPMMYIALTYDHRIVDGREAVGFLKRIKECVEDPQRMLIEV